MEDSPFERYEWPDDQGMTQVDRRLSAWFQQMLAEPPPPHFLDLIDRLDATGRM